MDPKGVNCDKKVVVRASSLSLKSRRCRRTLTCRDTTAMLRLFSLALGVGRYVGSIVNSLFLSNFISSANDRKRTRNCSELLIFKWLPNVRHTSTLIYRVLSSLGVLRNFWTVIIVVGLRQSVVSLFKFI